MSLLPEVIKYDGGPDVFAWKHPNEELTTFSQLVVNESQEVFLLKGGKIYDVFGPGRHSLKTANIPLLNGLLKLPFSGRSPFTAEVWFINKITNLDVKWGTPSPIQIQDPRYNVFIPVSSNGILGVKINDPQKLLLKLVGTLKVFDKNTIIRYFRGLYVTRVKDAISTYIVKEGISPLEINVYLNELSEFIHESVQPAMDEYGITLISFYINEISIPEDDFAVKKLKDTLAKRAEMNIIGYNYQQERSFDTLESAAKNEGNPSGFMGAGMGLGMGFGMGQGFGQNFSGMAQNMNINGSADPQKECPRCHVRIPQSQKYCWACGCDTENFVKEEKKPETEEKTEAKTEAKTCSSCHSVIVSGSKFCLECGRKLNLCPECGEDIPDGTGKCPSCGHQLMTECPDCHEKIPFGAKFCPYCGHKFE